MSHLARLPILTVRRFSVVSVVLYLNQMFLAYVQYRHVNHLSLLYERRRRKKKNQNEKKAETILSRPEIINSTNGSLYRLSMSIEIMNEFLVNAHRLTYLHLVRYIIFYIIPVHHLLHLSGQYLRGHGAPWAPAKSWEIHHIVQVAHL